MGQGQRAGTPLTEMLLRACSAPPRILGGRGRDVPPSPPRMTTRRPTNAAVASSRSHWGQQLSSKQLDVVVIATPGRAMVGRASTRGVPSNSDAQPLGATTSCTGRPKSPAVAVRQPAHVGAARETVRSSRGGEAKPKTPFATRARIVAGSQPVAPSSDLHRNAAPMMPPSINGGVGFRMTATRCTEPTVRCPGITNRTLTPHRYRTVKREAVWQPSSPRHVAHQRPGASREGDDWHGRPALQHMQERLTAEHILSVLSDLHPRDVESYVARHCHTHRDGAASDSGNDRNEVLQFLRKFFGLRGAVANHREPLVTSSLVGAGRLPPPACLTPPVKCFVHRMQHDAVRGFMQTVHDACWESMFAHREVSSLDEVPLCRKTVGDVVARRFRITTNEIASVVDALLPDVLRRLAARKHALLDAASSC